MLVCQGGLFGFTVTLHRDICRCCLLSTLFSERGCPLAFCVVQVGLSLLTWVAQGLSKAHDGALLGLQPWIDMYRLT